MKHIKLSYLLLLAGLSLLWLMADDVLQAASYFWTLRSALIDYTGILAIGAMSVILFLAIRPLRLERFFDGLDKTYRLHKWLGITTLIVAVAHWLWADAPKWLVGFGWLERPTRHGTDEALSGIPAFLHAQRGLAEDVGEWAFYAALLLGVLALLKYFPYRYFFKTHRLMAIVYLALVAHSVILMPPGYWTTLLGLTMAVLMTVGTVAAGISLLGWVGRKRQATGTVDELVHHPGNGVLQVTVGLDGAWPGHKAGQFAFVTFNAREGAHPFTIASAWHGDGKLRFLIKGLGDYTRTLPDTLKHGDLVKVEGPYGCFDFDSDKSGQIWVAGGIGITPFMARLQALAGIPGERNIDLFYSTRAADESFIADIQHLAERARVRLHVLVAGQGGRLSPEELRQWVPGWKNADIWFCGPAGFAQDLRKDLVACGLAADDFHQELFNMR